MGAASEALVLIRRLRGIRGTDAERYDAIQRGSRCERTSPAAAAAALISHRGCRAPAGSSPLTSSAGWTRWRPSWRTRKRRPRRRAQEAAAAAARAAEAKKQAELAAAAEAKKQAEQAAAAAAAAHAQHQAQIAAAAHGHAGVPAPGDQTAFNAERQRVMEAAARTGLPSPAAAQEAAFPTRFIITCTNCKTLMQAPKVPCHSPMSQPRARGARPLPSRISPG